MPTLSRVTAAGELRNVWGLARSAAIRYARNRVGNAIRGVVQHRVA
jgi:hypothetical protein